MNLGKAKHSKLITSLGVMTSKEKPGTVVNLLLH